MTRKMDFTSIDIPENAPIIHELTKKWVISICDRSASQIIDMNN